MSTLKRYICPPIMSCGSQRMYVPLHVAPDEIGPNDLCSYAEAHAIEVERDALKARVVELEKSDSETIKALSAKVASLSTHETCACSIDTPEDVCMHHSPEVMRLRKRVAEFEAARQWQPIATAPDEQAVLLYISASHYIAIGYYDGETWQLESGPTDEKPTHWMPLPEPLK